MVEKKINESEAIDAIVATPYKYGFTTNIGVEEFEKGLNEFKNVFPPESPQTSLETHFKT